MALVNKTDSDPDDHNVTDCQSQFFLKHLRVLAARPDHHVMWSLSRDWAISGPRFGGPAHREGVFTTINDNDVHDSIWPPVITAA